MIGDAGTEKPSQPPPPEPPPSKEGHGGKTDESGPEVDPTAGLNNIDITGGVGDQNIIAGVIYNQFSDEGKAQRLSLKLFDTTWTPERLEEERRRLCFDPDVVLPLASRLRERRVLVLAGEAALGKTSLALLVASSLRSTGPEPLHGAALCRALSSRVRVDVAELAGRDKSFHQRSLILRNAFASNNEDLLRFVMQLSASELDSYAFQLRRSGSFLLITADSASLPGVRERLKGLGILAEAPPPAIRDLEKGLERFVQRQLAEQKVSDTLAKEIREWTHSWGPRLCSELGSMPRLARFVREYLVSVVQKEIDLEDALRRTSDLAPWMLEQLPSDPEVWCSVAALTLCSADRSQAGVPCLKFDTFRRALSRFIRREGLAGRRSAEIRDETDPRDREILVWCRSDHIFQRARAEVVAAPWPEPDLIRFCDERYPDRLWKVLLGPGRSVTSALIPFLRRLLSHDDPYLQESAAQALGRMGQIDPAHLTYALIHDLTHTDIGGRAMLVRGTALGNLFEGIRSAQEDHAYRRECLRFLRLSARDATSSALQVVLISLHWIAVIDHECFALTLEILKQAAEAHLEVRRKLLYDLVERFRRKEHVARVAEYLRLPASRSGGIESVREQEEDVFQSLAVTQPRILQAFRFTLARLLLWPRIQGETLRWLLDWIRSDAERFGPLVAFAFLGRNGISLWLEQAHGDDVPVDGEREGSLMLEAIRRDEELAATLAELVEALYIHLRSFPGLLRDALERSFVRLLASWAHEARTVPPLRNPVIGLLSRLFASDDAELSERVLRLAQAEETVSTKELGDLRVLAMDAIMNRRYADEEGECERAVS